MVVMLSDELLEDFGEHDCPFFISAQAVTGEDGRLLDHDIDLSPSIEPLASQVKEPPKLSAEKPWNPAGMPELKPIQPPRQPLRVRNTVTGHVFEWSHAFTLSKNDNLEVIEWYGR